MPATAPGVCWTGAIGNTLNGSAIAATGDTVLAPSDTGALLAFGPDGTQRWSHQAGDAALAVRSVALDAATAYVATPTGIVSLSIADGGEGWRFNVPDSGLQLIAIDVAAGATPWGVTLQQSAAIFAFRATPAIVEGGIVVGTTDAMDIATLVGITDTGAELWRSPTELYAALMSPVVLGGRVYTAAFGIMDGGLLAFGTP